MPKNIANNSDFQIIFTDNNFEITTQANDDKFTSLKKNNSVNDETSSLQVSLDVPSPLNKIQRILYYFLRRDPSLKVLAHYQIFIFIVFSSCIVISVILEMIFYSRKDETNKILVFSTNIIPFVFIIFDFFTIIRIRWLRICGSVLIIIILIGSSVICAINLSRMDYEENEGNYEEN